MTLCSRHWKKRWANWTSPLPLQNFKGLGNALLSKMRRERPRKVQKSCQVTQCTLRVPCPPFLYFLCPTLPTVKGEQEVILMDVKFRWNHMKMFSYVKTRAMFTLTFFNPYSDPIRLGLFPHFIGNWNRRIKKRGCSRLRFYQRSRWTNMPLLRHLVPLGGPQRAKSECWGSIRLVGTWVHCGSKKAGSEDSETAQTPHPPQTQPSGSRQLRSPTGVQTLGIMEFSLPRLVRVLPRNRTNRMCITCIYDVCMYVGLPWWLSDRESACQCNTCRFNPWVRRSSGEGNGNPLQYSCLGSPMDRGAW